MLRSALRRSAEQSRKIAAFQFSVHRKSMKRWPRLISNACVFPLIATLELMIDTQALSVNTFYTLVKLTEIFSEGFHRRFVYSRVKWRTGISISVDSPEIKTSPYFSISAKDSCLVKIALPESNIILYTLGMGYTWCCLRGFMESPWPTPGRQPQHTCESRVPYHNLQLLTRLPHKKEKKRTIYWPDSSI